MTYTLKEEQTALLSTLATIEEQCEGLKRLCKLVRPPPSVKAEPTTDITGLCAAGLHTRDTGSSFDSAEINHFRPKVAHEENLETAMHRASQRGRKSRIGTA